jgi:hypothetical protein
MIALLLAAGLAFHPIQIGAMAAETPGHWRKMRTHIEVEGWVTYVATEDDGDHHIRICDDPKVQGVNLKRCVVAEIIPALPLPVPKAGDHVRVQGISRFDAELPGHNWWEVHPVLHIETLP